jgi:hypothetical protein
MGTNVVFGNSKSWIGMHVVKQLNNLLIWNGWTRLKCRVKFPNVHKCWSWLCITVKPMLKCVQIYIKRQPLEVVTWCIGMHIYLRRDENQTITHYISDTFPFRLHFIAFCNAFQKVWTWWNSSTSTLLIAVPFVAKWTSKKIGISELCK